MKEKSVNQDNLMEAMRKFWGTKVINEEPINFGIPYGRTEPLLVKFEDLKNGKHTM